MPVAVNVFFSLATATPMSVTCQIIEIFYVNAQNHKLWGNRPSTLRLVVFNRNEKLLIESYFWDGFQYASIVRFVSEYHDINISLRTLRRRLQDYGLYRRNQPSPMVEVWNAVRMELQGPGIYYSLPSIFYRFQ